LKSDALIQVSRWVPMIDAEADAGPGVSLPVFQYGTQQGGSYSMSSMPDRDRYRELRDVGRDESIAWVSLGQAPAPDGPDRLTSRLSNPTHIARSGEKFV